MKKVLLLMIAGMLIVGLMAGPAMASPPGDNLGQLRSVQVQAEGPWGEEQVAAVNRVKNGFDYNGETYYHYGQYLSAYIANTY